MEDKVHGNSHENMDDHHLYEIIDSEKKRVYIYGICGKSLRKDGSSSRANEQVTYLNLAVEWCRYFANILLTGIKGKKKAEEIELKYIEEYKRKYGKKPSGNRK